MIHRHIVSQITALCHYAHNAVRKGPDARPLLRIDVHSIVKPVFSGDGVQPITEGGRHRSLQGRGIGKAQHPLVKGRLLRQALRSIDPGKGRCRLGRRRRLLRFFLAEYSCIRILQGVPDAALPGKSLPHCGKCLYNVRVFSHQVQQFILVSIGQIRHQQLYRHHQHQQYPANRQAHQPPPFPFAHGLFRFLPHTPLSAAIFLIFPHSTAPLQNNICVCPGK